MLFSLKGFPMKKKGERKRAKKMKKQEDTTPDLDMTVGSKTPFTTRF